MTYVTVRRDVFEIRPRNDLKMLTDNDNNAHGQNPYPTTLGSSAGASVIWKLSLSIIGKLLV